jgi:beta-phosphoglucomutase
MRWIKEFQLFLFDFDGLLVNTEEIQFEAYKKMCAQRAGLLEWDFATFCSYSHSADNSALKNALYQSYPQLQEIDWSLLYAEKKKIYEELLSVSKIELMPGVERLLTALDHAAIRRCVVTNSTREQIQLISHSLPLLKTIPHWITREDYIKPKPHPEGYLRAITLYGKKGDRIVGFEDTIRGIFALAQTPAVPVMIAATPPEIPGMFPKEILYYPSFEKISQDQLG